MLYYVITTLQNDNRFGNLLLMAANSPVSALKGNTCGSYHLQSWMSSWMGWRYLTLNEGGWCLYYLDRWPNLDPWIRMHGDYVPLVLAPITPLLWRREGGKTLVHCYLHVIGGGGLFSTHMQFCLALLRVLPQCVLHDGKTILLQFPVWLCWYHCRLIAMPYGHRGIPGSASHWWHALVGVSFTCTIVFLSAYPWLCWWWLHWSDLPLLDFIGKESLLPCHVFFLLDIHYTYMFSLTFYACPWYQLWLLATT